LEGEGATFWFTLPLQRDPNALSENDTLWQRRMPPRQNVIAEVKSTYAVKFTHRQLRVLIADDNAISQRVAVRTLERLGVQPDVACNGRDAVEQVQGAPYDLAFMDCQMPDMNGYQAAAQIRQREGPDRRVLIIALTAEAIAGCREQCLNAGMDDFIAKPVQFDDFVAALNKWAPVAATAQQPSNR
jgi:CheY-like chemotaxis protein